VTTKYFALLTNQGAAKLANATALGTKIQITQMGVGDGGGTLPIPTDTQTALVGEKRRAVLNALSVDAANSSQIIAEQIIPENEGGFWIREIGLYDSDNTLIAVANCPETYKPLLAEGSGRTQAVRMILIVNSTDAVTLKTDPSVVLATRQYVDDKVIEVKAYTDEAVANMLAGVIGESRNAKMSIPTASATATFTADELIVQTALGGRQYKLSNFNKTINLASVGAGGMDTGAAPVSGFVALYIIFNPETQASALLAVNATLATVSEVYSGVNMPAGFTASALVSVWRADSSRLVPGYQLDRKIDIARANMILTAANNPTQTALSFSGYAPANAKKIMGDIYYNGAAGSNLLFSVSAAANEIGRYFFRGVPSSNQYPYAINVQAPQVMYYSNEGAGSPVGFAISISGYEI